MAGFEVGMVPVFIRIGDGEECEVGSFSPTATLDGDTATVSSGPEFAGFLRALADTLRVEIDSTVVEGRVVSSARYFTSAHGFHSCR